jgi:16S rRNA (adenine1518-N6/adenine1519-N6)-dimethyltransferase
MSRPEFVHPARLLASFGGRARKRFGQNFLASPSVIEEIVAAAVEQPGQQVLEVGPGLGVLTAGLLAAEAEVTAVEIDRDLVAFLQDRFEGNSKLRLVEGDASEVDWSTLLGDGRWVCAANLPYNVGTGLVLDMVRRPAQFSRLVVMLQEEVAQRILAPVGHRHRGSLSVYCQARAEVSRVVRVPPGAFHPPPKVKSAVIRLDLHPTQTIDTAQLDREEKVVRIGFSAPRKMVRKGLSTGFSKDRVAAALEAAGVAPTARPAELTGPQWSAVARALYA